MSQFKNAQVVESLLWQMRLADYPRGLNRSRVNSLFNGDPPYSPQQAKENNLSVNVNFLESTRLGSDARRQLYNLLNKTENFFNAKLDRGTKHKRGDWSHIITKELNKILKKSLPYYEALQSSFASLVLHGIGPSVWTDKQHWLPDEKGVEDILIPANALRSMRHLPFFAVYQPFTALQLYRLTHGPRRDPGWNMPLADRAIKWCDEQITKSSIPYSEIYSPEKMQERLKEDSGLYASDAVPTIDCWDFYFYNDEKKVSGWNRRIVIDANWDIGAGGINYDRKPSMPDKNKIGTSGEFLYDSGSRKYAEKREQIIHFQFGDLSAVAPFRYHSVRSLGFLLFAVCHLQNRLRCKFNDALFEHMLQYFRVRNLDDYERSLKINLVDKGYVDETVQFIPPTERWAINPNLVQMGLTHNRELIGESASGYTQDHDYGKEQTERTATEVMAQVQSTAALVSSALAQAARFQEPQYQEIARRFCIKNSKDADVRKFRVNVLKQGVPEELLDTECWEIVSEKILGGGNKILETAIAEKLLGVSQSLDPGPQRIVLRDYVLAVSDDPAKAEELVPYEPVAVTDTVHDAQLSAATLMMGLPVAVKTGINHIEAIQALMGSMTAVIQKAQANGGMATQDQIAGLQNIAQHISEHIQILARDKAQKERVKEFSDDLGKLMNFVKAFAQRLQQQMEAQAQQNGNGGMDPKAVAKAQEISLMGELKRKNTAESHAQRTAQRQAQAEMQIENEAKKQTLQQEAIIGGARTDAEAKGIQTAANINDGRAKTAAEVVEGEVTE